MTRAPAPTVPAAPDRTRSAGGQRRRLRAWAASHPGMSAALIVPVVVFGSPQPFGLTYLTGDNFIQNFPMRVLVGTDLTHWVLPLWNPYLFGGTPLLGGFNAGAAYPLTWLTAALPIFTAWTITLALTYDIALLGMYAFLRRQGVAATGATFGAVTFAFAGYMTGQMVHIDLIEGACWLPWILVAVHGLTEGHPASSPPPRHARRQWVLLLAAALGLTLLAGAAEAIIDSAVLVAIYWIWRLVSEGWCSRDGRRGLAGTIGLTLAGVGGGVALGCAQWLPGLTFLSQSQRATATFQFFTSGSLNHRLLALVASPFALGTNQGWPVSYAGTYNFPEVTSYVGILALIACFVLPLRRWRRRPESRQWWVWYVILVVGVLSSLGNQTPFARFMYLLPGVRSERLLNRNLLLVDMALAVFTAWWTHLLLLDRSERDPAAPEPTSPAQRWRAGRRSEVVATSVPFAFSAVACLLLWAAGPFLGRLLEIADPMGTAARLRLAGLVSAMTVVAAAATWTVLSAGRYTGRDLRRRLAAVLIVDLTLFNLFVVNPPITEATAQAHTSLAARLEHQVGDGRFIVYDPDGFEPKQLQELGQTDLNLYRHLPSAQGYTALTDGHFVDVTGAHLLETLDPTTLAGPVWDTLNVTTLLALPGYFLTPLPTAVRGDRSGRSPHQAADRVFFPINPARRSAIRLGAPSSLTLGPGTVRPWYFGGQLTLERFAIPLRRGLAAGLRVGTLTPAGARRWLPAADVQMSGTGTHRSLLVTLARPLAAGGLVVAARDGPVTVGIPEAETAEAGAVALDGPLQYGVVAPHWDFTGTLGSFGVFHNTAARGWAWVVSSRGGPVAGSSLAVAAPGAGNEQRIAVRTTGPSRLVRSVAWTTGWKVTVRSRPTESTGPFGPSRSLPLRRRGVVQEVALPGPGQYLVSFRYRPGPALAGMVVSAATGAALAIWGVAELAVARRRRRHRRPEGAVALSGGVPDDQPGRNSPMASADRM